MGCLETLLGYRSDWVWVSLWFLYHVPLLPLQPQTVSLGIVIIIVQISSWLTSPLIVLFEFPPPATYLISATCLTCLLFINMSPAPLDLFACLMTNCKRVYLLLKQQTVSNHMCKYQSTFWSSYSLPAARILAKTDLADPSFSMDEGAELTQTTEWLCTYCQNASR